ncbi:hypothetical protein [Streptomyces sp. NBC_00083]|uniref:hypothetical protein n=1 Tax=Streptomyces sp. NBC_00083 TaxID=2975647 RepID=UPI00225922EF|nr:hypothetical protein [Streptomyces sp. NBC_00083]MCX5387845.1 hypothetical protein [Streptomyces sp. NBC_00083]
MWAIPPDPLDAWLYEADPVPGCGGCAEAVVRLDAAKRAGDATARFEASADVRAHPAHGADRTAPRRGGSQGPPP